MLPSGTLAMSAPGLCELASGGLSGHNALGGIPVELPKEFFTLQSMLTLAGAAGATFVVCNGLQKAFNFNPRWLALAVAQVIVLAGTSATGATRVIDYLVAVINGFLVYLTAAGGTDFAAGTGGAQPVARGAAAQAMPQQKRRFLTPWF